MKQIHAVMNSASSKEQLFYSLYFEELVPPEEIAIILNISIDTVYSKKSKIIEKIKNALCVVEKEQG